MNAEKISAPEHLSDASKADWARIVDEMEIDLPAARILETFFDARERRAEARECIAKAGALTKDRFGVLKMNPAIAIERDSTLIMHRAFRLLGFDQEARGDKQLPLQY